MDTTIRHELRYARKAWPGRLVLSKYRARPLFVFTYVYCIILYTVWNLFNMYMKSIPIKLIETLSLCRCMTTTVTSITWPRRLTGRRCWLPNTSSSVPASPARITGHSTGCVKKVLFKGTVSWDRFWQYWQKLTDVGLYKCHVWFLNFTEAPLIFGWNKTSSFR